MSESSVLLTAADGRRAVSYSSRISLDGPCRSVFCCGPSSLPSPVNPAPGSPASVEGTAPGWSASARDREGTALRSVYLCKNLREF